MAKQVTAWQCEYCGKTRKNKYHVNEHEKACYRNTENHACVTCTNYSKGGVDEYTDCEFGINITTKLRYQCPHWNEKGELVHNPKPDGKLCGNCEHADNWHFGQCEIHGKLEPYINTFDTPFGDHIERDGFIAKCVQECH